MLASSLLTLPRPDSNDPLFHVKTWVYQSCGSGPIFIRDVLISRWKFFRSFWSQLGIVSEMKGPSYWSLWKAGIAAKQVSFRMYSNFHTPVSHMHAKICLHSFYYLCSRLHQFSILKCDDFIFTLWQHMLIILKNINNFSTVSTLYSHCSIISIFAVDENLPTGVIVRWQSATRASLAA